MGNFKSAVLSLSGGMDSSSLLLHLLAQKYDVTALGFDYGQKHKVELERAQSLVDYINSNTDSKVKFQVIKLDGLSSLLNSSLVTGGSEVPEGHYEQDNMKATVVPNRNKIFSSIIQAVALSITQQNNHHVAIAMGIHAGDHQVYLDCRQEFRDADYEAFKQGNDGAEAVKIYTPYLYQNKFDILEDGLESCKTLGLDFDEVYKRTNTSYKPMKHKVTREFSYLAFNPNIVEVEEWFSDYKSAASVERIEAFIKLGRPDPVSYANEEHPVTWEVAKAHVEQILADHNG